MNPKDNINAVLDMAKLGVKTGHDLSLPNKWRVFKRITRIVWYTVLLASAAYLSILIYG